MEKNVFCEVQSSYLLQNFTYQVVAHGKVIYAENVDVPNRNYHVFKFMATFDLVPEANIIVYRFHNGEFVSTTTRIEIEEDLNNFLKLKLSKNEVKPGSEVNIDVITNAASHVGLMGVDQSVLLLKKNKGLTRQDAVSEMNDYQNHFYDVGEGTWSVLNRRSYYINTINTFDMNNVIFFSNGLKEGEQILAPIFINIFNSFQKILSIIIIVISKEKIYHSYAAYDVSSLAQPHRKGEFYVSSTALSSAPVMDDEVESSNAPQGVMEPPKIRTEFPETWLWEDFDVNK